MIKSKSHLLAFSVRLADYTFKFHQRQFDLTLRGEKPVCSRSTPAFLPDFFVLPVTLPLPCPFSHLPFLPFTCSAALWEKHGWKVKSSSPLWPPVSHGVRVGVEAGVGAWSGMVWRGGGLGDKASREWALSLCTQHSPNLHLAREPRPGSLGDGAMRTVNSPLVRRWVCLCCSRMGVWSCVRVHVCAQLKKNKHFGYPCRQHFQSFVVPYFFFPFFLFLCCLFSGAR